MTRPQTESGISELDGIRDAYTSQVSANVLRNLLFFTFKVSAEKVVQHLSFL